MKNCANPWRISFPSSMKISTSFWRNFLQSSIRRYFTFFEFFGHGGTKHHNLFVVRGFDEDLLDVGSHSWIAHDFIAFVDNKEFALGLKFIIPWSS